MCWWCRTGARTRELGTGPRSEPPGPSSVRRPQQPDNPQAESQNRGRRSRGHHETASDVNVTPVSAESCDWLLVHCWERAARRGDGGPVRSLILARMTGAEGLGARSLRSPRFVFNPSPGPGWHGTIFAHVRRTCDNGMKQSATIGDTACNTHLVFFVPRSSARCSRMSSRFLGEPGGITMSVWASAACGSMRARKGSTRRRAHGALPPMKCNGAHARTHSDDRRW